MDNNEYRTRLEILLDFFKCASASKNIKTISVEGTGFFDDAEIIIDLIEKELEERPKGKPIIEKADYLLNGFEVKLYKCPRCNTTWKERFNFCPECGLAWRESEVEE